jgi:hypothetical protein
VPIADLRIGNTEDNADTSAREGGSKDAESKSAKNRRADGG